MDHSNYIILESLIRRYDYAGAIELIGKIEDVNKNVIKLLYSCKYAINFDFQSAYYVVSDLLDIEDANVHKRVTSLKDNLKELIDGRPDAIFSELLENTKIQLDNRRYIDFLSRVYRIKEAILKYIFAKNHVDKNRFSFRTEVVSKRMIIKILRKKYKIFNPNLSFAISSYITKYLNKDKRYNTALDVLNSNKMNEMIELRHECIAGHGFKGVNRKELVKIYGNPYAVIDDFYMVLEKIGVNIRENKYDKINGYILELL
ncbi:hypothetical protein [Marinisporobacter balticus]|uniref:Uncharacterized protein n=1 Tax=Marinisporobacter balticus TaxID=2018667 RepID=A0A4R2KME9_9FIRM|nr:hypothetical protein [Marinisporobacter balticus]TCO73822.1 hypothetical protein EV214_11457 [Marinisporobacter balticus]